MLGASIGPLGALQLGQIFAEVILPDGSIITFCLEIAVDPLEMTVTYDGDLFTNLYISEEFDVTYDGCTEIRL